MASRWEEDPVAAAVSGGGTHHRKTLTETARWDTWGREEQGAASWREGRLLCPVKTVHPYFPAAFTSMH